MQPTQLAIYGAGGNGRQVQYTVHDCNQVRNEFVTVCFIDDDERVQGSNVHGVPVLSLDEARLRFPDAKVVCGVGSPQLRQRVACKAADAGFRFATIIHPRAERTPWVTVGEGTILCLASVLSSDVTLGRHVLLQWQSSVGHDGIVGDFTVISPGVHIAGCVHIGKRVFIGIGATIINGTKDDPITIGDDAVIGAGACVTRSVDAGLTVVGVPARPIRRSD